MEAKRPKTDSINPKTRSRPLEFCEPRWVYCDGYRCLAVLDKQGKWWSYYTGEELKDFVKECKA